MNRLMILPSLVFISKNEWDQDDFRDDYFETMINAFEEIDASKELSLVWSYRLEELLWDEPQYRPWSELKEKNTVIPIFYKFFRKNIDFISHDDIKATSKPGFEHEDLQVLDEYYCLSNNMVVREEAFALFKCTEAFEITSKCKKRYVPVHCSMRFDILKLNLKSVVFSGGMNEKAEKFKHAVTLYANEKQLDVIHCFSFSNSFIRRIEKLVDEDIIELIDRLALRVSYSGNEARQCVVLQDEFIAAGGINEFRMRITNWPTSKRVHYVIQDKKLLFKHYYGVGDHDNGL